MDDSPLLPDAEIGHYRSVLDTSGFPLQAKIQNEITSLSREFGQGWTATIEEQPWRHPQTGDSGYIDLVATCDRMRLIIECKRQLGTSLLFQVPLVVSPYNARLRCLSCRVTNQLTPLIQYAWKDCRMAAFDSSVCIIEPKSKGLLETVASTAVLSSEALADQEGQIMASNGEMNPAYYVPVIVTTARLLTWKLPYQNIGIEDGKVTHNPEMREIKWARLSKPLTIHGFFGEKKASIEDQNSDDIRTVFIVQAQHLVKFLSTFRIL